MSAAWLLAAGAWIKAHWKELLWALGGAVATAAVMQGCHGEVVQAAEAQARAQVLQMDVLKGQLAQAGNAKAKVVYVHVPGQPCPDVRVEVEAESRGTAEAEHAVEQAATAEAAATVAPPVSRERLLWIWPGAGFDVANSFDANSLRARAALGIQYGPVMLEYAYRFDGYQGAMMRSRF